MINATTREAARYTGRHCVMAHPDGEPVSPLYVTHEIAEEARQRLRMTYPGAVVGYWPTRDESATQARKVADADAWCVSSFAVVTDGSVDGVPVQGLPASPALATREQAAERLATMTDPTARIIEQVLHCRTQEQYDAAVAEIVQP